MSFHSTIPHHVAIIMDGNGRWAVKNGFSRLFGHRKGVEVVREIVKASIDLKISVLTLYAFSTENWHRPKDEIFGLMDLFRLYLRHEIKSLAKDGVCLRFLGDKQGLDEDICQLMCESEEKTASNDRLILQIALNYGGRDEILMACRSLATKVAQEGLDPCLIDEAMFHSHLYTKDTPDPDLIIRTSGENRMSNFLLWQAAYSEYISVTESWPEFNRTLFENALEVFQKRKRRFGALETDISHDE